MTLAADPGTAQPVRQPNQITALVLLGPPGSGRRLIGSCLEVLGRGRLCRSDITRPLVNEEGRWFHYVPSAEFEARMSDGQYLFPRMNDDNWIGCQLREVSDCFQSAGTAIITADQASSLPAARRRLLTVWPACRILTVLLLTEPPNAWVEELRRRQLPDLAERIRTTRRTTDEAITTFRHEITRVIKNRVGQVRRTVFEVETLLRS